MRIMLALFVLVGACFGQSCKPPACGPGVRTATATLTWQEPTAGTAPAGFNIYRSDNGLPYRLIKSETPDAKYVDTFTNSGYHTWYVTTVDASGAESPASNIWTFGTRGPLAPVGVLGVVRVVHR